MTELPFYLAAFALVIGILVVVHESGHYLAARWCGVKVLRFSFGFGKVIWQRRFGKDETEWAVSVFPLGGYVKMLDEREAEVDPAERHRAFNTQSVGRRSLIVAAGPLANFLLAIGLYWIVFMSGTQALLPVLGTPQNDTPAAMAGFQSGDQVLAVDEEQLSTWDELRWLLLQKAVAQESAALRVSTEDGRQQTRDLYLAAAGESGWEGDAFERLGLRLYRPLVPPVIGKLQAGSPADLAGVLPGDRILAVDGQPVRAWHEVVLAIREVTDRPIHLDLQREGEALAVDVQPAAFSEAGRRIGRIGISVAMPTEGVRDLRTVVRYGVLDAGVKAIRETWDKSVFSLVMMGKMLTGEVSWKNLSGPVTIADYAGQSAKLGLDYYLKFMALVSISLGVLNLLPVPVLDGGHLMYHMIEVIRRKPLSERAMVIGQQVGLSILFVLMAFAFFNDLTRLFGG